MVHASTPPHAQTTRFRQKNANTGNNFSNIFGADFLIEIIFGNYFELSVCICKFLLKKIVAKAA